MKQTKTFFDEDGELITIRENRPAWTEDLEVM